VGRKIVRWHQALEEQWATLRFGEVKVQTKGKQHAYEVQVYLNDLDPKAVRVELYADGINGGEPVRQEMRPDKSGQIAGASGGHIYSAAVPAARPPGDYTARVMLRCDGVSVPLEAAQILWQR
jgi:starch phosphorylase